MKNTRFFCLTMVALAVVIAGTASAQVSDTDYIQQVRVDTEADRQVIVTAGMELTDAEGQAFWPVYRAYRSDMAKAGDRLQKLIQNYAEIFDNVTEEQAETMTDEMLDIKHDQLKVRKSYVKKFRKVISEVKVLRFLQIENKLDVIVMAEVASGIPLVGASE